MRVRQTVPLRFVLPPENVERFAERLDRQSGVAATPSAFCTIYLDTPELAFGTSRMTFGVRRDTNRGKRASWKRFAAPVSATTPRTAIYGFKRTLREAADIIVVARVDMRRRTWTLRFADCEALVCLEYATVSLDGKDVTLAAVTWASAAPNADFFHFIASACEADALRLTAESDPQRIYRLCGAVRPYVTACAPQLDAKMSAADAFRAIAASCLEQFLLNEAAIRATGDHEAVHQCRVALRRLSACLHFFAGFIDDTECRALRRDLKEFGAHLRAARDLDVLISDVIAPALAVNPPPGAEAFMREIEARRSQAHADLAAVLNAPASTTLYLRFALWLQTGDWTRSAEPKIVGRSSMPIADYARHKFKKLDRKFVSRCAVLGEATQEQRHRTRIQAKNMRYDAEFLRSLAHRKSARNRLREFIDAVKDLQTVLGDWNDIAMARQFLTSLDAETGGSGTEKLATKMRKTAAEKRGASHAAVAEALIRRMESVSEEEFHERSAKACRALVKLRPFWTKLA